MPLSTDPLAIKTFRAAYAAAQVTAQRVDVMRWETPVYFAKYCAAARLRTAAEVEAAKLGFAEGFEAGQKRKADKVFGRVHSLLQPSPTPRSGKTP